MTDRESPRSRRPLWAGIAAITGGLGAILLTVPSRRHTFTHMKVSMTSPSDGRSWSAGLSPLLGIAAPVAVYETDGRIYGVALLLYLPATIVLHRRRAAASGRTGTAGFRSRALRACGDGGRHRRGLSRRCRLHPRAARPLGSPSPRACLAVFSSPTGPTGPAVCRGARRALRDVVDRHRCAAAASNTVKGLRAPPGKVLR